MTKLHLHFCSICQAEVGFSTRLYCADGYNQDHEVDPCSRCWQEHEKMLAYEENQEDFREIMENAYPSMILLPSPSDDQR